MVKVLGSKTQFLFVFDGVYTVKALVRPLVDGGIVRVVLLEHAKRNWAAYISTDPWMSVETILQTASDCWAIGELFHT